MWENKDVKEVKAKKIIKSLDWDRSYNKDLKQQLENPALNERKSNAQNNKSKDNKIVLPEPKFKPNLTAVVSKIDTGQSKASNLNKNTEKSAASINKESEPKENPKIQELKLDFNGSSSKEEPRKNSTKNQTSLESFSNNESLNNFNQESISLVRQNTLGEKKSFFPNNVRQIYPMVHQSENEETRKQQAYAPLSRGNSKVDLNEAHRPKSSTIKAKDASYLKQDTYPKFPQPGTIFTFQNLEINKKLSAIDIQNNLTDRSSPDGDESSEKYSDGKF